MSNRSISVRRNGRSKCPRGTAELRSRGGRGADGAMVFLALLMCVTTLSAPVRADHGVSVEIREPWSAVFAASGVDYHVEVGAAEPFRGRGDWRLAIDRRTVASGGFAVDCDATKPARRELHLDLPPVRDDIVVTATLAIRVFADGREGAEATVERTLRLFPKDPFRGRLTRLGAAKIRLFDPEKTTARVLEAMHIPFAEVTNEAELGDLDGGLLIVGEGASFDEHRDLSASLVKLAAKGIPVLCLAPAGGSLAIPGLQAPELPEPTGLSFRRQDVIAELDKRLDARAWPPDGRVIASVVSLGAEGGSILASVSTQGAGWPWVEVTFPAKKGRLVVCGFGLISRWESGPSPRFLLARILDVLAGEAVVDGGASEERNVRR